mgnify:CR=1 FL=1
MKQYPKALAMISNICVQAFQERPEFALVEYPYLSSIADKDCKSENNQAIIRGINGAIQKDYNNNPKDTIIEFALNGMQCYEGHQATIKLTLFKGEKIYNFLAYCDSEEKCKVYNFDRCPTDFDGTTYDLLVFIETYASELKEKLVEEISNKSEVISNINISTNGTCELLTFHADKPFHQELINELNNRKYVQLSLQLVPVTIN